MGERYTLCTHQMLDLQSEQGQSFLHPDQCILPSNIVDYTNRSIYPMLPALGNIADLGQFREDHDRSMVYGNHYNSIQNCHAVPNIGLSAAAPSNSYNPSMFPSSSSRIFPIPWNNGSSGHMPSSISQRDIGISMDEFGRSSQFLDCVGGSGKRKNAEVAPGNYNNIDGPASPISSSSSFISQNCGLPQWEQLYESGANLVDATNFAPPEYREGGTMQTTEGSHRSVRRSRSSAISSQPESAFFPYHNYSLQGTHTGHSLHPASSLWISQFGTGNNIGDGGCSNWNYTHSLTYLHGRCLSSGAVEMTNTGVRAYHDASSSTNSSILLHPASLPNFYQHLSPVQAMQVQSYSHHAQIHAPSYQHPVNNLHHINVNTSSDSLDSGSRFPHFPSNAEQIYRPRQLHHAAPEYSNGRVRILSSEDATAMELEGFYVVGNVIDQHQDMRLDIDEMSYEELLALEEQIGDVNTGLTEEYIIKNLKKSLHVSQTTSLPSDGSPGFSQENEACIICQVEYEEGEIIGTLDCGHNYHGECIRQWLRVKNLCPICKTTALATDKREG